MAKHKSARYAVLILVCFLAGCNKGAGGGGASDSVKLESEDQKMFYAMGLMLGGNVKGFSLKPEELAFVKAGLTDAANGATPQVELDVYGPKVSEFAAKKAADAALEENKKAAATSLEEKKKGQAFADTVAKEKDVTKTPSGIVIRTITAGSGASPAASDTVKVDYEGKLVDGTIFDSSKQRGEPVEFRLNEVVPCWTEALQTMKKGGKAQIVCPSDVAYGERGRPPKILPGATLSFEVELLDFHKTEAPPAGHGK